MQPFEPVHEISNNVVCATSKASDEPVHMRSLIRALNASRLRILWLLSYWLNIIWSFLHYIPYWYHLNTSFKEQCSWGALPRGAMGLSAVCDCGISWSYSLLFKRLQGSSESTFVKMPHCWQSHVAAHLSLRSLLSIFEWLLKTGFTVCI